MPNYFKVGALEVAVGQYSDKGRKAVNQDRCGAIVPREPQLSAKGLALALADGISSSDVSHIASEAAIKSFLEDYFCTSDAWSVKKSAQRVLMAINSWLHAQTLQSAYRFDKNRGYVCTLSALIVKSTTAHLFHVGDSRIYRVHDRQLEQLTNDHRLRVGEGQTYLSRALGINNQLEIDYRALQLAEGDIFFLATDGVYEYITADVVIATINRHLDNLDEAARLIAEQAFQAGSQDNLSAQLLRVIKLPQQNAREIYQQLTELPFPPLLEARMRFDGYKIVREIHASSRSHVYLASDETTDKPVVIKIPSVDLQQNAAHLERFLMEEWIAKRINNPHVLKAAFHNRKRHYFYTVSEYVEGQTLSQWMIDNPKPDLEAVRALVEQIAKGLQAFHRLEMVHQDIRPENIMVDNTGTVTLIDFGSTKVAGIAELDSPLEHNNLLGTVQYMAPEYFIGEPGNQRGDIFSLAVITYQMLTGRLPYGTEVAKAKTRSQQYKLVYQSALLYNRDVPLWVDGALRKALHPDPYKRYSEITEFIYELRNPNEEFLHRGKPPLLERNPVLFWKSIALIMTAFALFLTVKLLRA